MTRCRADESDDEYAPSASMPSARISTSMVNQATAHLQKDGRSGPSNTLHAFGSIDLSEVVPVLWLCCAGLRSAVLCCAVLRCAVLCCAVLCCAVLCCAWMMSGHLLWCGGGMRQAPLVTTQAASDCTITVS
jgi:hypothetical protein